MIDDTFDSNAQTENIPVPAAFAGRQTMFERIQQYLIDPTNRHALLFVGRTSIGKSALLIQCLHILGNNVIGCYLPLSKYSFTHESDWLFYLIQQTNQALEARELNITRLPMLPDDSAHYRQAILDEYLPELTKLIRPHRRFIWLMDDAEYLIEAINNNHLPDDTLQYLYTVLQTHLQIGIVMTLDENNESQMANLTPLIDASQLQRLHPLSSNETTNLVTQFTSNITDSAKRYIYQLTDGHPLLLQAVGQQLDTLRHTTISEKDVDAFINHAYEKAHEMYRSIWQQTLSQNERLVLTAISGLLYDDPLGKLTTQRIESWLLETDFPLDITSINASIRGLEYRDLVVGSTSEGIRLRARLFQRWLIENAQMDKAGTWGSTDNTNNDSTLQLDRRSIIIIVLLIISVLVIVAMLQQSNNLTALPIEPTVTLEP